jgi:putative hemolysin
MHIAPQDIDSNPLSAISSSAIDRKLAQAQLPPLLRSYLGMGGYVGADAIIDHDLGTILVFAGLDIAEIPPARAKSLRSLAKGLHIATAQHS